MDFDIEGKGIIIVDCNGTMNYLVYKNNEELREMVEKVYVRQGLKDITVVDCDYKKVYWVTDDEEYANIIKESE